MLQKETSGYKWNNIKYTGLLSVMCESPGGICIHSFCSSLDFLVVYIELKQVITKTYIYKVVWNIV